MGIKRQSVFFGVIHGSFMTHQHMEPLAHEFRENKFGSESIQIGAHDPLATVDDFAKRVYHRLPANMPSILIAHSGGAETAIRTGVIADEARDLSRALEVPTKRILGIIFVCGSLRPSTLENLITTPLQPGEEMPTRNTTAFRRAVKRFDNGLSFLHNPEITGPELLYADASASEKAFYTPLLRPTRRTEEVPKLRRHPTQPMLYVRAEDDPVITREYTEALANHTDITVRDIHSGHSPAITATKKLAELSIDFLMNDLAETATSTDTKTSRFLGSPPIWRRDGTTSQSIM
jgi:pimeloyl-ACP methyl ester carboxylesterase